MQESICVEEAGRRYPHGFINPRTAFTAAVRSLTKRSRAQISVSASAVPQFDARWDAGSSDQAAHIVQASQPPNVEEEIVKLGPKVSKI